MNEEMQNLIKENIRLTRENNHLLRKMWRAQVWSFWSKILFVVIMVGVPVLVYQYYLSDVLRNLHSIYFDTLQSVNTIQDVSNKISLSTVLQGLEDVEKGVVHGQ